MYISLRVPRIDRASTDPQQLPCVVVQVVGKTQIMYRLRCKLGVLKVCYDAGDLEEYCGNYGIPVAGRSCSNDIVRCTTSKQLTIEDLTKLDEPSEQQNSNDKWLTCGGIMLHMKQLRILHLRSAWLDDQIIVAAQSMLKQQHPLFGGFQSPILGSTLAMSPPDRKFVQVIIANQNHWVALSTVGCQLSTIRVYDRLGGRLPKHCLKLVGDLMQSRKKLVTVEFVDVQEQKGASDCGLFALAYITSICNGQDPATLLYDQAAMRPQLRECFEKGRNDTVSHINWTSA